MSERTHLPAWQALEAHAATMTPIHLRELFASDPQRFATLSLRHGDWLLDFSKQRLTTETLSLLRNLAAACNWREWLERMRAGEAINHTEQRAVSHTNDYHYDDGSNNDHNRVVNQFPLCRPDDLLHFYLYAR